MSRRDKWLGIWEPKRYMSGHWHRGTKGLYLDRIPTMTFLASALAPHRTSVRRPLFLGPPGQHSAPTPDDHHSLARLVSIVPLRSTLFTPLIPITSL